eukprot:6306704-Amphidinium_carterae.1
MSDFFGAADEAFSLRSSNYVMSGPSLFLNVLICCPHLAYSRDSSGHHVATATSKTAVAGDASASTTNI